MHKYRTIILFFFFLFFNNQRLFLFAQTTDQNYNFSSPLDIPLLLSGNFGELRATHFHAGIDFKTEQITGKNVIAIEDGYISRIRTQSSGYGKSLYITHPNGFVSVYGHLNNFVPILESFVKSHQYEKESFEVNLFPPKNMFVVGKGEIIAYSGNTGGSDGPHLHFEIRDERTQNPQNVLKFGFNIKDDIKPVVKKIAVYPVENAGYINNSKQKLIIIPSEEDGIYTVGDGKIEVFGEIGFGIETYDYLNDSENRCTIYSIELKIDDTIYYYHEMNEFSFDEEKYVNSHIDYAEKMQSNSKIHKLFPDPNNKLSIYKILKNRGGKVFNDDLIHQVQITIKDTYLNASIVKFEVQSKKQMVIDMEVEGTKYVKNFYYTMANKYENKDVKVNIPADALFNNIDFCYSNQKSDSGFYSDIHSIHSDLVPLFKSYTLSIRAESIPDDLRSRSLIAKVENNGRISSQGGKWKNGFVTAQCSYFGKFVLTTDTIPPDIRPVGFENKETYSDSTLIVFKITDNLSGIRSYNGYINNKWVLFEYDLKSNLIFYTIDSARLEGAEKCELKIVVSDKYYNISEFKSTFYVK